MRQDEQGVFQQSEEYKYTAATIVVVRSRSSGQLELRGGGSCTRQTPLTSVVRKLVGQVRGGAIQNPFDAREPSGGAGYDHDQQAENADLLPKNNQDGTDHGRTRLSAHHRSEDTV